MAALNSVDLDLDSSGNPRSLRRFALVVDAEARRHAAAASRPPETDLVRAFRGGVTPSSTDIRVFLERAQRYLRLEGTAYVLASVYLTRFIRSRAGREAGIHVEPATAHRLVAVAVILGAKYWSSPYCPNSAKVFDRCSDRPISPAELAELEIRFLRAIDWRLYVSGKEYLRFCKKLERGPPAAGSCGQRKRKAAGGEEEEARCIRACRPPVVV